MNCREFEEKLPFLADDLAPAVLRAVAERHAAQCPRCARLLAAVRGETEGALAPAPSDLLPAVLEQTGGLPCERIGERLVQLVDGELRGLDASLVERHLEGCTACREIVAALHLLGAELPLLAEAETDARFVVDVLERTAWARREPQTRSAALASAGRRLFGRPRVAFELAYGGALLLYILAGSPHTAMRELSAQTSSWVERNVAAADENLPALARPIDAAASRVKMYADLPREQLAAWPAPGTAQRVVETVGKLLRSADLARQAFPGFGRDLIRGHFGSLWRGFLRFREEMNRCWSPPRDDRPETGTEPSPAPARPGERGE